MTESRGLAGEEMDLSRAGGGGLLELDLLKVIFSGEGGGGVGGRGMEIGRTYEDEVDPVVDLRTGLVRLVEGDGEEVVSSADDPLDSVALLFLV